MNVYLDQLDLDPIIMLTLIIQLLYRFKDIEEDIELVHFSSEKLMSLSFKFKYGLKDMYKGAIETCRAKGLLPLSFENEIHDSPTN